MFFTKEKPADLFARQIVGEWRAETARGSVTGEITAVYHPDGSFLVRSALAGHRETHLPAAQIGRYRIEPVDRKRFHLVTIDENGAPVTRTVRSFPDPDTMVNAVGSTIFRRVKGH
jgi:hypothetical protein